MGTKTEVKTYNAEKALPTGNDDKAANHIKMTVLYGHCLEDEITLLSHLHVRIETEDKLMAAQKAMGIAIQQQHDFPEMFIGQPHVHYGHIDHFDNGRYHFVIFLVKGKMEVIEEIEWSCVDIHIIGAVKQAMIHGAQLLEDSEADNYMAV